MSLEVESTRVKPLNSVSNFTGQSVVYVMSRDQRVKYNHALLSAQKHALAKKLPLIVVFCLYNQSGWRALEHFDFMLAGLKEVEKNLASYSIPFMMVIGDPHEKLSAVFKHLNPDAVFLDFSPLAGPSNLHQKLAKKLSCPCFLVDTHNIVPAWIISDKREVGAYTIRPKFSKILKDYLIEPDELIKHPIAWPSEVQKIDELSTHIEDVRSKLKSNGTKQLFQAGEAAAQECLKNFITNKMTTYALDRNNPNIDCQSNFSPYLHYGQISALDIALRLREEAFKLNGDLHILNSWKMPSFDGTPTALDGINSLLEEMIVRKELADNFCYHCPSYLKLKAAPEWALNSLAKHAADEREYLYDYEQFKDAKTHDPAWNAAQKQLTSEGKMHGYMRMYWAKKVLEWSTSPEEALEILIKLNDFYSIDGGDPNGYTGILWSIAGLHDRPWFERPVFGVIRYMNYGGLARKFDIKKYIEKYNG